MKAQDQSVQILMNEAYVQYAAIMMKDATQHRYWAFCETEEVN